MQSLLAIGGIALEQMPEPHIAEWTDGGAEKRQKHWAAIVGREGDQAAIQVRNVKVRRHFA
jgi:hypothetical protein